MKRLLLSLLAVAGAMSVCTAEQTPAAPGTELLKELNFNIDGNSDDAVAGKAMMFDGKRSIPLGKIAPVNGQLTVSLWVKIAKEDFQKNRRRLVFGSSYDYWKTPMSIFWDGENYRGLLSAAQLFTNSDTQPGDRYVHLAWTVNGNIHMFYMDGNLIRKYDDPKYKLPDDGLEFYLGGIGNRANFIGLIDEVTIFGRTLGESEVKALAGRNSGK